MKSKWMYFIPFYGLYAVYKSEESEKGKWWAGAAAATLFCLYILSGGKDGKEGQNAQSGDSKPAVEAKLPTVGEKLQSSYFEITLKGFKIQKAVDTGNMFVRLEPEEGNKYLILDVSYKNTDKESRMIGGEGKVSVNYDGKDYEYEKSETIMLDGWGVFLEQLNPLTQKNTKLVFKIPSELKGRIYWEPSRGNGKFLVGEAGK
ncbi:MAG TPA: DUF4352 domain-containing protein [Leptospiraceae bacterium]|nr:DUF4352 domain-containing protein [Leptospiraceae bacterium]